MTEPITDREQIAAVLQPMGVALDRWAWQKLVDSHPELADTVEAADGRGVPLRDIRRYVMERTQHSDLANFVEQAARWLTDNQ